jgi:hypothetical protein
MLQTLLEVDGIGMLFESSTFFPILGVHILASLVCVVTGIVSMVSGKRAGLHPICGTIYHWGLAVLVTSAGFLAAAHWTDDRMLLVLGSFPSVRHAWDARPEDEGGRPGRHRHHFYGLL